MKSFGLTNILICTGIMLGAFGCEDDTYLISNHHPDIQTVQQLSNGIPTGSYDTLICKATDDDGDVLDYFWTAYAGSLTSYRDTAIWYAPLEVAKYPFLCRVEDRNGGYDEISFDVQVYSDTLALHHETINGLMRILDDTLAIIKSQEEYNSLWMLNHPDVDSLDIDIPAIDVNFDSSMIIIISFGYGPHSGCNDDVTFIDHVYTLRDSLFIQGTRQGFSEIGVCFSVNEPRHWAIVPRVTLPSRFIGPTSVVWP